MLVKIQCSKYTDKDEEIIRFASSKGIPIIGGTALEIIANHYGVPGVRKRSDNDLDFIISSMKQERVLQKFLFYNDINPDQVRVDCFLEDDYDFSPYVRNIGGVVTMSPAWILWSKLTRGSSKDIVDIKWLLKLPQEAMSDDELSETCETLGVTEQEISLLESLIAM